MTAPLSHDVIVVGGGFAGVTAAREAALRGRSVLLLEARERLGGRTWTAPWKGVAIEYGGGWVHWHQPHTWSEITRAGLAVALSDDADERLVVRRPRCGARARSRSATRSPTAAGPLRRGRRGGAARRRTTRCSRSTGSRALTGSRSRSASASSTSPTEEHDVLWAELESLAHAPLEEAGAVSVLRWHALSGYSLRLAQYTGGRVTLVEGTARADRGDRRGRALRAARSGRRSRRCASDGERVEVTTRAGEAFSARAAIVAVPLNVLARIVFEPDLSEAKLAALALGQASRGIKIFIRARGERAHAQRDPAVAPVRLPRHRAARSPTAARS